MMPMQFCSASEMVGERPSTHHIDQAGQGMWRTTLLFAYQKLTNQMQRFHSLCCRKLRLQRFELAGALLCIERCKDRRDTRGQNTGLTA